MITVMGYEIRGQGQAAVAIVREASVAEWRLKSAERGG